MDFKRYRIRKEFFGCLIHDRQSDAMYMYDKRSFQLFSQVIKTGSCEDQQALNNMRQMGYINDRNQPDYDFFENAVSSDIMSAPMTVHYVYTHRCNLNCKHCYSKRAENMPEMNYEQKLKLLDQVADMGVFKILIGGGEPFTCKEFIPYLKASVERGLYTRTFTNGLLLNDEMIDELSKIQLGGISVSVDSTEFDAYETIRGVRSLDTVICNIKKLSSKCNYSISMSATIGSTNLFSEDKLLDLAKECGVHRLKIRPTKPSGNALKNTEIEISPDTYADYIKRIRKLYIDKGYDSSFVLDTHWGNVRLVCDGNTITLKDNPLPYDDFSCIAGKGILAIGPTGTVNSCGFLTSYFGESTDSILKDDLNNIWQKSQALISLRNIRPNPECVACNFYSSCRGGCPARNLHAGLEFNAVDPWCPKNFFPMPLQDENN